MKVRDISIGTLLRTAGLSAVAGLALSVAAPAEAGLTTTIGGQGDPQNDCGGVFGAPPNCSVPEEFGGPTPLIIKIDFDDEGDIVPGTDDDPNPTFGSFGTIDGSEFTFDFNEPDEFDDGNTGTGTWFYDPNDADDPAINFYVAKGGPGFNLFDVDDDCAPFGDDGTSCTFFTPTNLDNDEPFGLSHLTFYDTVRNGNGGPGPMPEPATLLSLGAGLAGLGLVGRRRRRAV